MSSIENLPLQPIPGVSPPDESIRVGPPADTKPAALEDFKQGLQCSWTSFDESWPIYDEHTMEFMIYQLELGQETNKFHWQGYTMFKTNKRYNAAAQVMGFENYWLKKAFSTPDANINYCTKLESRVDGPYEYGNRPKPQKGKRNDVEALGNMIVQGATLLECFTNIESRGACIRYKRNAEELIKLFKKPKVSWDYTEPNNFQKQWIERLLSTEPDKRKVIFIVDTKGGIGKSELATYFSLMYKEQTLYITPDLDMKDVWSMWSDETKYVFVNVARAGYHNYRMYENIKDRNCIVQLYMRTQNIVNRVHLVVLCNTTPDVTKMSADRYEIINY